MKKLVFDVTDANTILESDSVGAFIRAGSDGALIDSQLVNAQEWLNTASILYDDAGAPINAANPLKVSVTDGVNVEVDLSHVDDSVRLGDGTSFFTSTSENGDIALDVHISNTALTINDAALAASTAVATAETLDIASTSQDVIVAPLANRKYLFIYNKDNRQMFIGGAGVTEATGYPINPEGSMELRAGAAVDIEFVSPKLNHEIRTLELS